VIVAGRILLISSEANLECLLTFASHLTTDHRHNNYIRHRHIHKLCDYNLDIYLRHLSKPTGIMFEYLSLFIVLFCVDFLFASYHHESRMQVNRLYRVVQKAVPSIFAITSVNEH